MECSRLFTTRTTWKNWRKNIRTDYTQTSSASENTWTASQSAVENKYSLIRNNTSSCKNYPKGYSWRSNRLSATTVKIKTISTLLTEVLSLTKNKHFHNTCQWKNIQNEKENVDQTLLDLVKKQNSFRQTQRENRIYITFASLCLPSALRRFPKSLRTQ